METWRLLAGLIGNISIRTAIRLLEKYSRENPEEDPLGILHYRPDYQALVRDLIARRSHVTEKFAGLMIAEGKRFFEANAVNWLSPVEQEALLVTYYKVGPEYFQRQKAAALQAGAFYNAQVGDIGLQHIFNVDEIEKARLESVKGVRASEREGNWPWHYDPTLMRWRGGPQPPPKTRGTFEVNPNATLAAATAAENRRESSLALAPSNWPESELANRARRPVSRHGLESIARMRSQVEGAI